MAIEYANLGNSGLKVSKIIFGCMSFGEKNSQRGWILSDEEEVFKLLKKAYDSGVRTFDTANVYANGSSEIYLGKFLKKYNIPRSTVVILTKVFGYVNRDPVLADSGPDDINRINRHGLSRKHILDSVNDSVNRLGTYIDLLQIHRFDKVTPVEETMEALHDVIKGGQVRYIGASSMFAYQFALLQHAADKHGWTKFISMQNHYSAVYREEEREMIPYCKATNVALIPWGPVAAGKLTRPLKELSTTERGKDLAVNSEAEGAIINRVEEIAKKRGVSMAIVATAWVLHQGTYPIIGFSSEKRIDEAIEALSFKLTEEEIQYINEPYEPRVISGHD